MQKAEIYTKPHCPFCVRAKKLLQDRGGFDIEELCAIENRDALITRVTEASGVAPRTVPQIFLDGQYVGGHDDLVAYFSALDAE